MYLFDKLNKGFTNNSKVNCFMNAILQSLIASPAFFNLLQAIAKEPIVDTCLEEEGILKKMVHVGKFFNLKN